MSPESSSSGNAEASFPAASRRPVSAKLLLSVASVIILVWSEIWITIAAAIWSVASMLHTGTPGMMVLAAILMPVGLWASFACMKMAWNSERNLEQA